MLILLLLLAVLLAVLWLAAHGSGPAEPPPPVSPDLGGTDPLAGEAPEVDSEEDDELYLAAEEMDLFD